MHQKSEILSGFGAKLIKRRKPAQWTNAGDATSSPFTDETPSPDSKPEKRRYRAVYLAKNQSVGQYSDIVTVVTTP